MKNYDSVISQMQSAGLIVDQGIEVGRLIRTKVIDYRDRRGWYFLHDVADNDNERIIVGTFGIWRGNDNGAIKVRIDSKSISKEQSAAIRKRIAEDKKRAAAARAQSAEKAAARATAVWKQSLQAGESEYLVEKKVKAHGIRFTDSGSMVIPMLDASGNVHGLQFILPRGHARREKTGRNKEYWPTGLIKKGHWFQIGMVRDLCLVCEGYATGASLHEATGLPVAVAFDANNMMPVGEALRSAHGGVRLLFCADDDHIQKCRSCGKMTTVKTTDCDHCGEAHGKDNAGIKVAESAALATSGDYVVPVFETDRGAKKITDFNDLHDLEGLQSVRVQVEERLNALRWLNTGRGGTSLRAADANGGGGEADEMITRITINEGVDRYWGTYGLGGDILFDEEERRLVHKKDAANLLPRHGIDDMRASPDWRVARDTEIGFDPTEKDDSVLCNLFGGWPTEPIEGSCEHLLEMLEYLCDKEPNREAILQWMLKWLAYPIQHRGAKMHSALVVHGPQGSGKSRFFEAYSKIFGPYGRVLGQEALEDKFNADWAEKKLFILADEVLARSDMYHIKNRLKGFITGDTIRVNPKNLAAHNEKNQMNIVFLSNERQPLVLENDDRRHCVVWVPPKPPAEFFSLINDEIDNGGIEALHYYLLNLDLGDFKPWTHPPMTRAKQDLIDQGTGSEERFINEWLGGELENEDGESLPVCPCLGSSLYRVYESWCKNNGEFRHRPANQFIGFIGKIHNWAAGRPVKTRVTLNDKKIKNRKLVIPSEYDMNEAVKRSGEYSKQHELLRQPEELKVDWATRCFFAFENSVGFQ